MAKRLLITVILAGVFMVASQIIFNVVLPVAIFPCTITFFTRDAISSVCSLRDVNTPPEYVIVALKPSGEIVRLSVMMIIPIAFFVEFRLTKRKSH